MNIPENLRYAKTHEWARLEDDGTVTVGITDHAQELLGDMVFVQMPEVGRQVDAGAECAVVESVKAAADVYAPVAGEVAAVNAEVESDPELVNQDAFGAWLFRLRPRDAADLDRLLDAAGYQRVLDSEDR